MAKHVKTAGRHLWNAEAARWELDALSHCLAAPSVIHVLGRHPKARVAVVHARVASKRLV